MKTKEKWKTNDGNEIRSSGCIEGDGLIWFKIGWDILHLEVFHHWVSARAKVLKFLYIMKPVEEKITVPPQPQGAQKPHHFKHLCKLKQLTAYTENPYDSIPTQAPALSDWLTQQQK